MQMPQGGAQIIFLLITSITATFISSSRILGMIFNTIVSIVGLILIWKLDPKDQIGRMVGLTLAVVYAINLPISLSIVTSNVAGFSKKSVVSSLLFIAYCVGNIAGPQFFLASEEPSYPVSIFFYSELSFWTRHRFINGFLFPIDWYQSFNVGLGFESLLPYLLIYVLHLGEPAARQAVWLTGANDCGCRATG